MKDNLFEARTEAEKMLQELVKQNNISLGLDKNTFFNDQLVAQRNPQFILSPNLPLSPQQRDDDSNCINGGNVTKSGAEYQVQATTATNSKGVLTTKEKGNYISGNVSGGGIGTRPDKLPQGDAYMKWGPYDYNGGNRIGGYFHLDSDGLRVILEDQGTIVDQFTMDEWNINKLSVDILEGNVYHVVFGYYGYLPFVWQVSSESSFNPHSMQSLHWYKRKNSISISNPNLPITAEVDSGTTGQEYNLYVGGRQFSTYGKQKNAKRFPAVSRSVSAIGSTGWTPIIAIRKKSSFEQVICEFEKLSIIADNNGIWRIVVGDAPTGGSGLADPPGYDTGEVATEYDITATAAGSNTSELTRDVFGGNNNVVGVSKEKLPPKPLFDGEVYSLEIQAEGVDVSALCSLGALELW